MGLFDRLKGRRRAGREPEHAVITHIPLSDDEFGDMSERSALTDLEGTVAAAIDDAGAGEHDGHEFGGGEFVLYSYGPDADRLWHAIEPVLRSVEIPAGAYAIKRYGEADDPTSREERVRLT
jgi:hypothetical protein